MNGAVATMILRITSALSHSPRKMTLVWPTSSQVIYESLLMGIKS